jgi:hypothetical protein
MPVLKDALRFGNAEVLQPALQKVLQPETAPAALAEAKQPAAPPVARRPAVAAQK